MKAISRHLLLSEWVWVGSYWPYENWESKLKNFWGVLVSQVVSKESMREDLHNAMNAVVAEHKWHFQKHADHEHFHLKEHLVQKH